MGSASVKLLNMTDAKNTQTPKVDLTGAKPVLSRADSEIRCVVESDDGSQIPADIDQGTSEPDRKYVNKSTRIIMDEIESQAEVKRNELRVLLIEHQQIVSEIRRLELWKTKQLAS